MRQVEPVDRLQEAAEALLEQVGVGDPPVAEPLGDMGDKPHVGQRELAAELGVAVEDGTQTDLGRSTTHGQRRDVLGQALRVIGPLDVGPLDPGQCLGELPLALGQATEQFASSWDAKTRVSALSRSTKSLTFSAIRTVRIAFPSPLGASFQE